MVYKAVNGQAPLYISSLFNRISAVTNIIHCNSNLTLRLPRMKTKLFKTALHIRKLLFGTHCQMTAEQLKSFRLLK